MKHTYHFPHEANPVRAHDVQEDKPRGISAKSAAEQDKSWNKFNRADRRKLGVRATVGRGAWRRRNAEPHPLRFDAGVHRLARLVAAARRRAERKAGES